MVFFNFVGLVMVLNLMLMMRLFWLVIMGLVFFIFMCSFGLLFNLVKVCIIGVRVMGIIFIGSKKVEFNLFINLLLFIIIRKVFVKVLIIFFLVWVAFFFLIKFFWGLILFVLLMVMLM